MNDYATVDDLETEVGLDPDKYEDVMQRALDTAAEHVNNLTNRIEDGYLADSIATTREFVGNGTGVLRIDECVEITAVAAKATYNANTYTNWLTTDWIPFRGDPKRPILGTPAVRKKPYNQIMVNRTSGTYQFFTNGYTGTSFSGFATDRYYDDYAAVYNPTVQVTAKWGYAVIVPDVIKSATIVLATRHIKRAQAVFGDAIGNNELGTITYTSDMDKDVKGWLFRGRFMKPAI